MCNTFDRCCRGCGCRRRRLNVTLSLMTAKNIYDIKNAVCIDRVNCGVLWCFGVREYDRTMGVRNAQTRIEQKLTHTHTHILGNVAVHKMQIRWKHCLPPVQNCIKLKQSTELMR